MTLHGQAIRSVIHDGKILFFFPNLKFGNPKPDPVTPKTTKKPKP